MRLVISNIHTRQVRLIFALLVVGFKIEGILGLGNEVLEVRYEYLDLIFILPLDVLEVLFKAAFYIFLK